MARTSIFRIAIISQCWLVVVAVLPSSATASGATVSGGSLGDFTFHFFGVATLGALVGAFCIWLGYKLFTQGIQKGKAQLDFNSRFFSLVFSGVGPGLFFMAFGALIVLVAVIVATVSSFS